VNTPVLTSAVLTGGELIVTGYVGAAPDQAIFAQARVDLYLADTFGPAQGKIFLGSITADASGNFAGSIAASGLTYGEDIIATATDVVEQYVGILAHIPADAGAHADDHECEHD